MSWVGVIAVILIGLFFTGFFSGVETGLYRVNRLRVRLGVHEKDARSVRIARFLNDKQEALSVVLVGTNVANYLITVGVTYLFADLLNFSHASTELYAIALVTPVVFVFGEMVPKTLFQLHPDRLMAAGSALLAVSNRVLRLTGFIWFLTNLARWINRRVGVAPASEIVLDPKRHVTRLLQESLARDASSAHQSMLIEEICRLSETPLHRVMVPRNKVRMIPETADRRELLRIARRTDHTRLPVYAPRGRKIVGTIKIDELLQDEGWQSVGERVRPPLLLDPHEHVATAIVRMRQERRRLAVVANRAGHFLGVVALKDLLRQAVGEIAADV